MFKQLKKSTVLSRIFTISSWFWALSTSVFFISLFAMILGWFGKARCPNLMTCGDKTLPALSILAFMIMVPTFFIMISSGILRLILKTQRWMPPLNLTAAKTILASVVFLFLLFGYFFVSFGLDESVNVEFTGVSFLEEVNNYRKSEGLPPIALNQALCNNIVDRWKNVKEGKQHEGFEEWYEKYVWDAEPKFKNSLIAEEYVTGMRTGKEALDALKTSPGHDIVLKDAKWTLGCTYANEGVGILIMSYLK